MAFKPRCSECGSFAINHQCHGRDGSDGHLCDVCYWRTRAARLQTELEETRANAALIAAAPDMLAALLAAVECGMVPTSSATEGGAMKYVKQAHVADQIRAAIKKAKGGKA